MCPTTWSTRRRSTRRCAPSSSTGWYVLACCALYLWAGAGASACAGSLSAQPDRRLTTLPPRLAPLLAEHHAQVDRMRRCALIAHDRRNKGRKEAAPCRALYDYQREGGCQSASVCTECWAHEFTDSLTSEIIDAKTGNLKPMAETLGIRHALSVKECGIFRLKNSQYVLKWMPHVCYMSHPGEATWNPEWTNNRNAARPPRSDPRGADPRRADPRGADPRGSDPRRHNGTENARNWRGADQRGGAPAAPIGRPPTNRFAGLESAW